VKDLNLTMKKWKERAVRNRNTVLAGVAAVAAVAALGACSNSATKEATSSAPAVAQTSTTAPAVGVAHNHADMMFAEHMIPHHQQAVEMSDMILAKQGIDPRVVDLAKQIKAAQAPEIEQMQGWLNQWDMPGMGGMSGTPGMGGAMSGMPGMHDMPEMSGTPATTTTMPGGSMMPSGSMMPGMPGMDDMPGMQGMMSAADMQALKNAEGVTASKLFLTQMITHHQGAITMAQNEIKDGLNPDAIALANSIITGQQKEIDTMNQILSSL
jgi:uncharacterized protein (DUF305 family)